MKNLEALEKGFANMDQHIDNLKNVFGLPVVVAINQFPTDTQVELDLVRQHCADLGVRAAVSQVVARGGEGGIELANAVLEALDRDNQFKPIYPLDMPIKEKIRTVAQKVYRADGVVYTREAEKAIDILTSLGYENFPICIAKTQMSFSDEPALKGAPKGWELHVRDVRVSAGAGFIVVLTGNMLTMPGLPKYPAAEKIDILKDGTIIGLF